MADTRPEPSRAQAPQPKVFDLPRGITLEIPRIPWVRRHGARLIILTSMLFLVVGFVVALLWPRRVDVRTTGYGWTRVVHVERYQINAHEGFIENEPAQAFDVAPQGVRYHHTDQVYDHDETEHYTVSVNCGETCVEVPRSCYTTPRNCTSNQNGFASCTGGDEVCTGGGQQCTPKFCDEDRTRQVPVYRDVPRYATWYAWRVWEWTLNRDVASSGTSLEAYWPSDEQVHLNKTVSGNETERASYEGRYSIIFTDQKGKPYTYQPKTYDEFRRYAPNSPHVIKVGALSGVEVVQ